MSFLNKDYVFVKQEKFDEFLKAVGVPEDKIALIQKFTPGQKLAKDGDDYIYYTTSLEGPKEVKFKSGVEFDDVIGADNTPIKSTYTVDGNTVTQIIKSDKGTATFTREYNGDDLVVTITTDLWPGGVSKRYYKAA